MRLSYGGRFAGLLLVVLLVSTGCQRGLSGLPMIVGLDDVRAAVGDPEVVLIDARFELQYQLGHIPGAVHFSLSEASDDFIARHDLHNRMAIVYCGSPECDAAGVAAALLRSRGCRRVLVFPGGWQEWAEHHAARGH